MRARCSARGTSFPFAARSAALGGPLAEPLLRGPPGFRGGSARRLLQLITGGASLSKFELTSRNTPRKHCKYHYRSVLAKESRAYPRDAALSATPRGLQCLPREGGSQGGGTYAPCTCSQGGLHLTTTSFCAAGRPNKRGPWPGRSRPPSASVLRRIYFPRP